MIDDIIEFIAKVSGVKESRIWIILLLLVILFIIVIAIIAYMK